MAIKLTVPPALAALVLLAACTTMQQRCDADVRFFLMTQGCG